MLRVALTGGIACGKSTVGAMLARRGAHLLAADALAHELYAPGTAVYDEVVRKFGEGVLDESKCIDRAKLAQAVFPNRVGELNAIVHPAVIEAQKRWMSEVERDDPQGVAVVEAALIFEAGVEKDFDKVLVVTCDWDQKAARFASRMGVSMEKARVEIERRSAAQLRDEEKARRADYVIANSSSLADLEEQVEKIWNQLQALAGNDRACDINQ